MALVVDPTSSEQLNWVQNFILNDEPVGLPTETVYGLGGRVYSEKTLARIFALKARPHFDPLIAHVSGSEMAKELCSEISEIELDLMQEFWPGPLTILCPKSHRVPDLCTGGSSLVGLRSPANEIFQNILNLVSEPLAAPSANRFQGISPTDYRDVLMELGPHGLSAVVDGGACKIGIESTVVWVKANQKIVQILRPGACDAEKLDRFANERGLRVEIATSVLDKRAEHQSPGQLAKHYSPQKPVIFFERPWETALLKAKFSAEDLLLFVTASDFKVAKEIGALESNQIQNAQTIVLGESFSEAACTLFKEMRKFDANIIYRRLVAFAPQDSGLGAAIADRLRRSAGSY
jgi:L-threonylcarbamoyladenylate synthase